MRSRNKDNLISFEDQVFEYSMGRITVEEVNPGCVMIKFEGEETIRPFPPDDSRSDVGEPAPISSSEQTLKEPRHEESIPSVPVGRRVWVRLPESDAWEYHRCAGITQDGAIVIVKNGKARKVPKDVSILNPYSYSIEKHALYLLSEMRDGKMDYSHFIDEVDHLFKSHNIKDKDIKDIDIRDDE